MATLRPEMILYFGVQPREQKSVVLTARQSQHRCSGRRDPRNHLAQPYNLKGEKNSALGGLVTWVMSSYSKFVAELKGELGSHNSKSRALCTGIEKERGSADK